MSHQEKIARLERALQSRNIAVILKTSVDEFGVDLKKMETLSNLSDAEALGFIQTLTPMLDFKTNNRSVLNTCSMLGYTQCVEYIIPRTCEDGIAEAQSYALAFNQDAVFARLWKEKSNLEFNDQTVLKKLLDKGLIEEFFQGLTAVGVQPKKMAGYFHRAMMSNRVEIYEALYSALTKLGVEDFNPLSGAAHFQRLELFKKYVQPRYLTPDVVNLIQNQEAFLDTAYPHLNDEQKISVLPFAIKHKWDVRVQDVLKNVVSTCDQSDQMVQHALRHAFIQSLKDRNFDVALTILSVAESSKSLANQSFEYAASKKDQQMMGVLLVHTTQAGRASALINMAFENNSEAVRLLIENVDFNEAEIQLYQRLQLPHKDVQGLLVHPNFNESFAALFNKIQRHTLHNNIDVTPALEVKKRLI